MIRRTNLRSSFTLWLLGFTAIFAALQVFPITGVILMIFGAPLFNLVLIYALVIAFVIDCLIGPLPRVLLVVPVLGLGVFGVWYKALYDADQAAIPLIEAQLQARNTATPVHFDQATQSLVSPANQEMINYRIPVVYTPDRISPPADKYIAFAIRPMRGCNVFSKANPQGTDFTDYVGGGIGLICVTRSEVATLPGTPMEIKSDYSKNETIEGHDVTVRTSTLMIDGAAAGQFTTGYTSVVPPWPMPEFGCFLIDSPAAWKCISGLGKQRVTLDTVPGPGTLSGADTTGMLLDLERRTPEEIASLTMR